MADVEEPNDSLLWSVIGFVFIMMVIGTYVGKYNNGALTGNGAPTGTESGVSQNGDVGGVSLLGGFLSSEPIIEGGKVINAGATKVRQTVGGAIIGEQEKRATAEVVEGPVTAFGERWYRLNYKNAPDGWVSGTDITANIGTFRALNIVPIFFSVLQPIGLFLTIIFLVILVMIIMRQRKTVALIKKRKLLEREVSATNAFGKRVSQATTNEIRVESDSSKTETNIFQASAPPSVHTVSKIGEVPSSASKETAPSNLPTGDISGLLFKKSGDKIDEATGGVKNEKWERVQRLLNSYNTNDWKQSIMEADIMLEEMLNKMGYKGNGIGEMLKQIEESDFVTLNKAWEAHKVRNTIAHRGGDQVLSKDEAERVIGLYKKVFEEFYYI